MRIKPSYPRLNRSHPLAAECRAFWAMPETDGPAVDVINGCELARQGITTPTRSPSTTGPAGRCVGNQVGFAATTPAHLRLTLPITFACRVVYLGTPVQSTLFGVSHNNTAADPYVGYELDIGGGVSGLGLFVNSAGTFSDLSSSVYPAVGVPTAVVGVLTRTTRTIWLNGVVIASTSGAYANPTYGATSQTVMGYFPATSRNSNLLFECGGVWAAAWDAAQVAQWTADPFAIVRPGSHL